LIQEPAAKRQRTSRHPSRYLLACLLHHHNVPSCRYQLSLYLFSKYYHLVSHQRFDHLRLRPPSHPLAPSSGLLRTITSATDISISIVISQNALCDCIDVNGFFLLTKYIWRARSQSRVQTDKTPRVIILIPDLDLHSLLLPLLLLR
jgi:hypothetical protein